MTMWNSLVSSGVWIQGKAYPISGQYLVYIFYAGHSYNEETATTMNNTSRWWEGLCPILLAAIHFLLYSFAPHIGTELCLFHMHQLLLPSGLSLVIPKTINIANRVYYSHTGTMATECQQTGGKPELVLPCTKKEFVSCFKWEKKVGGPKKQG